MTKKAGGMDMLRDEVLALLREREGEPLSGEAMSRALGVSRAAVWKAMEALRQEGYEISSAPRKGYWLEGSPDRLSPGELARPGRMVGRELVCLDRVDSTNNEIKRRAVGEAADGLAVVAGEQTGGRGRRGRSFVSPPGKGLYLSVLLRPNCPLAEVPTLTAWSAVAVCDAVEEVCGVRPGIKWPNDVILEGRKLCGILTELELEAETAALRYVVVGIGVNISQTEADFGPEVAPVAVSLAQALGKAPRRAEVARALLDSLDRLYGDFPRQRENWLARYRADCLTVGRPIRVISGTGEREGTALGVEEDFSLRVAWKDGGEEVVSSGEVSVRGLLGYV
ncbi:biotin--[acetyl-CoA-carboxylase] ligase [Intestinimonas massiliensis (ex Afouda et al. 2020)]|uniref:biotin--[acetyl-CoA-carboxylase] ligase n=1 Tax=Intestinimonas massiliensis (ex Afouda et al. 2020) TaxID=1673721 RepID=UPI001F5E4350|nr:biotin--[acetyl-CoA-carboxylase] ligase [Intestinimonas massiliensis (ex Afouda et al. 2020)]